jgi:hypothetical protein
MVRSRRVSRLSAGGVWGLFRGGAARQTAQSRKRRQIPMADIETALKGAMSIEGALGAALVDYGSGMTLGTAGGSEINLQVAAAGNTDVVRAKLRTVELLGLPDQIEDILITLDSQYHLIRPLSSRAGLGLFLYLALNRSRANLALARHQLRQIESNLQL